MAKIGFRFEGIDNLVVCEVEADEGTLRPDSITNLLTTEDKMNNKIRDAAGKEVDIEGKRLQEIAFGEDIKKLSPGFMSVGNRLPFNSVENVSVMENCSVELPSGFNWNSWANLSQDCKDRFSSGSVVSYNEQVDEIEPDNNENEIEQETEEIQTDEIDNHYYDSEQQDNNRKNDIEIGQYIVDGKDNLSNKDNYPYYECSIKDEENHSGVAVHSYVRNPEDIKKVQQATMNLQAIHKQGKSGDFIDYLLKQGCKKGKYNGKDCIIINGTIDDFCRYINNFVEKEKIALPDENQVKSFFKDNKDKITQKINQPEKIASKMVDDLNKNEKNVTEALKSVSTLIKTLQDCNYFDQQKSDPNYKQTVDMCKQALQNCLEKMQSSDVDLHSLRKFINNIDKLGELGTYANEIEKISNAVSQFSDTDKAQKDIAKVESIFDKVSDNESRLKLMNALSKIKNKTKPQEQTKESTV